MSDDLSAVSTMSGMPSVSGVDRVVPGDFCFQFAGLLRGGLVPIAC
jgi:hypothetical protein